MSLRSHGILAFAPNVSAYDTIESRSEMWKQRLVCILEETGAERLNLIAHSMGGLDARYLITQLNMHHRVASLVTVSTPHRGSSMAQFVLERPDRVKRLLADLFNWMGKNSLEDAHSDFLTTIPELTPEFVCNRFNPDIEDHSEVKYYSYAARAGRGTSVPINPFLRIQNGKMYDREGENDGFVAVQSARWGKFLGIIDADHTQLVGLSFPGAGRFDSNAFYLSVVRRLAASGF